MASGKFARKNFKNFASESRLAKLTSPSAGRNRMQANVPSTLGKAISMCEPRGSLRDNRAYSAPAADGQLLMAITENLLRKRHPANLEHGQPNCRRCAV